MQYIKGPDFPTGGVILGKRGHLRRVSRRAGASIITRAKSEIEEMHNGRQRIVVTEIPYQVNKARLIEKIAEMVHDKRLEGISDIRDESDRSGMRIVIELKRDVNANVVLNYLYQAHPDAGNLRRHYDRPGGRRAPRCSPCGRSFTITSSTRNHVITRRTQYDLDKAEARSHILEGLLIALDNIDEVIALIRASARRQRGQERPDGALRPHGKAGSGHSGHAPAAPHRPGTGQARGGICRTGKADRLLSGGAGGRAAGAAASSRTKFWRSSRKYADERRTEISALDGRNRHAGSDPGRGHGGHA